MSTLLPQSLRNITMDIVTVLLYNTTVMNNAPQEFGLDEVCTLTALSKRTVRYYIQIGLVDRPLGSKRGAYYVQRHIDQLMTIRRWRDAGVSLERVRQLMGTKDPQDLLPPPIRRKAGAVEVWSHVVLGDGLELHIEPGLAGLCPEQVRALAREVMRVTDEIKHGTQSDAEDPAIDSKEQRK